VLGCFRTLEGTLSCGSGVLVFFAVLAVQTFSSPPLTVYFFHAQLYGCLCGGDVFTVRPFCVATAVSTR